MLKVDFAILCEDVRTEANGKNILIGVYSGNVLVRQFPLVVHLMYWIAISNLSPGRQAIVYKIHDGRDATYADYTIDFDVGHTTESVGAIPTRPCLVTMNGPGRIVLSVKAGGGSWTDVLSKRVDYQSAELLPALQ